MFSQWFCISKLGNQATNISFPSSFACVALCMALCVWLFWPQQRRQPEEYENFHKICSLWPFSDNKSFRSFNKEILWPASTLSGVPCVCVCVGRRFAYFEGAKLIWIASPPPVHRRLFTLISNADAGGETASLEKYLLNDVMWLEREREKAYHNDERWLVTGVRLISGWIGLKL